jgi:hypothetical protein
MASKPGILAIYDDYPSFLEVLRELRRMGIGPISTFAPVPLHEVDEVLGEKRSPVRFLTLIGGILGFGIGAAVTVLATEAYPLIVGGKPLISIPPYLIIAFELTILFATGLTAIGYFTLSPASGRIVKRSYDPSFSVDRFGLSIPADGARAERLKEVLKKHGALEIRTL